MESFARSAGMLPRSGKKPNPRHLRAARADAPAGEPPVATAEDVAAARTLAWDALDRAIGRYHETMTTAARARELAKLDHRLDRWAELEAGIASDAATWLLRAILATDPTLGLDRVNRAERFLGVARGVVHGGQLYLAVPDPNHDAAPGDGGGVALMQLQVVNRAAILEASHVFDPGLVCADPAPEPSLVADPAAQPEWVQTVMKAAEDLGEAETRRRIFGHGSGLTGLIPDWREVVLVTIQDLGRGEAMRRIFLAPRPPEARA